MLWQEESRFRAPPPCEDDFRLPARSFPARRGLPERWRVDEPVARRPVVELGQHRHPVPDVDRWLGHLYRLCAAGKRGPAVDQVLWSFDDLLFLNDLRCCDEILKAADVDRLMVEVMLAFLMETFRARSALRERAGFYDRVQKRLATECPDEVDDLLQGLG